jgi:hypothetical protein
MSTTRQIIESAFEQLWDLTAKGEVHRWADLFSPECSFVNPVLKEPVLGRENVRSMAKSWPRVENESEWHSIDGNRLVVGWHERRIEPDVGGWYRGFSTFVFDRDGLISSYEAMFDTDAVRNGGMI